MAKMRSTKKRARGLFWGVQEIFREGGKDGQSCTAPQEGLIRVAAESDRVGDREERLHCTATARSRLLQLSLASFNHLADRSSTRPLSAATGPGHSLTRSLLFSHSTRHRMYLFSFLVAYNVPLQ
jgi:hypothetical protein